MTKAKLTEHISKEMNEAFPGVVFSFSQVIQDNVEEAAAGVKGENSVKVVGPSLKVNESKAEEIVKILSEVRGVTDLGVIRSLGQPEVHITADREACARYGLNVGDVQAVVQAAIGGQQVTTVYEGEQRFDLVVRWQERFREDLRAIRNVLVSTPDGAQIPLGQLAKVERGEGALTVFREDGWRMVAVKFSVRGRDLGGTIADAQTQLKKKLKLPYDTHLEWAGEIKQLEATTQRLMLIVPLTLILITLLVYMLVNNYRDTLVALASVPIASAGGVLALVITGQDFSISAAMGFISIFGIAIQDSLIVISYVHNLWKQGYGFEDGIRVAAERRLRPVLMTTFVALIGLLPAALSRGIGSETQKPLAIVVIGGATALAVLLPTLLKPALLVLAHRYGPMVGGKTDSDVEHAA
jgi:cobalt-zinc-cadmium resistance protein CzcA